jgi:hypothetical protein
MAANHYDVSHTLCFAEKVIGPGDLSFENFGYGLATRRTCT